MKILTNTVMLAFCVNFLQMPILFKNVQILHFNVKTNYSLSSFRLYFLQHLFKCSESGRINIISFKAIGVVSFPTNSFLHVLSWDFLACINVAILTKVFGQHCVYIVYINHNFSVPLSTWILATHDVLSRPVQDSTFSLGLIII